MSRRRPLLVVVGAGKLARALAPAWASASTFCVGVAARRPARARAIAAQGARIAAIPLEAAVVEARVLLLAVPDAAVSPLARRIAPVRPSWRGTVVLHAAGAYGPELLAPLARRGAATGILHPLAVLGRGGRAALRGAFARVEGAPRAAAAARRLARAAGLVPLEARRLATPAGRAAYHAAAALASNDVLALVDAAARLLERSGMPRRRAERALAALLSGLADQIAAAGTTGALTGPAARGDADTLARHAAALRRLDPGAEEIHRLLSARLAALARGRGRSPAV